MVLDATAYEMECNVLAGGSMDKATKDVVTYWTLVEFRAATARNGIRVVEADARRLSGQTAAAE